MAEIGYCEGGGCTGLLVTLLELRELARKKHAQFIDEFVPVPNMAATPCSEEEHQKMQDMIYYETPENEHGWACRKCGQVLQWG